MVQTSTARQPQVTGLPAGARPLTSVDPVDVGGYRLTARLGAGGTADVFLAVASDGRPAVVKVFRGGSSKPGCLVACRREFDLASAVDIACTPTPLDFGMSGAGAYLATAYLPGFRCGSTLVAGTLATPHLWALGHALARTLSAIHAPGVVHCDVKPANLLVNGADIRLIDFGIARRAGGRCGRDGVVPCSRGWGAPEQLRAALATPAFDVFAWGCVIAYLSSGVHPFASRNVEEWILLVSSAEPDIYGVPPLLATVVARALARDPEDRPSADELAATCRAHLQRLPRSVPHRRPAVSPDRRRPAARDEIVTEALQHWPAAA